MPTDDDVLKARLKTVGVSEYKFEMEVSAGRDSGTEWRIVDVGGSRSQRRELCCPVSLPPKLNRIMPFSDMGTIFRRRYVAFDSSRHPTHMFLVDAIIFLAPISGFDQVLAEDRTVNRLVRKSCSSSNRCLMRVNDITYHLLGGFCPTLESRMFIQTAG